MGLLRPVLTLLALALVFAMPAHAADEDLASHVDPMIGTFAPGFIFPGAAAPFGMVQNSPDTRGEFAYSGYLWTDPAIQAFSLVHLSGPGVKKGGDIPVMPVLGEPSLDPNQIQSPYDHATENAVNVMLTSLGRREVGPLPIAVKDLPDPPNLSDWASRHRETATTRCSSAETAWYSMSGCI